MPTPVPSGYSGRSLPDKLGFRDGLSVGFIGLPEDLQELATCRMFGDVARRAEWPEATFGTCCFDAIHAFATRRLDIEAGLPRLQEAMRRDGFLWLSWPKKAARVPTDVTENVIRDMALALDLVDVKVAAVTAVWSGLKLVIRRERR